MFFWWASRVPPPISSSLASRHSRSTGYSLAVAGAAHHLHRVVGDGLADGGGEQLGGVGADAVALSGPTSRATL
jgi:hypothetical protein